MKEKQNIWKSFVGKFNIKRFSFFLLAAFFFLVLTKFSETYTQSIIFDIELVGLNDEVMIKKDSAQTLNAIVRAKGFSLLPFILSSTNTLSIDASSYTTKTNKFLMFDAKDNRHLVANQLGNAIDILSVKPDTVYINYNLMSSKWVNIQLNTDIEYASGFDIIDDFKLSQDSVKLVGSKNQLDTISYINTKLLRLKGVKENISSKLDLEVLDEGIDVITNTIMVNGEVKRFTEGKITLDVELVNSPSNKTINYFPKKVDLIYYVDLDRYKAVDYNNFKVVADYNSLQSNQNSLELQVINTSKIVKSTRLTQNRIEFIILE